MRYGLLLAGCLFAVVTGASAQVFSYDNEDELKGAAAFGPPSQESMYRKLSEFCAGEFTQLAPLAKEALTDWINHNEAHLSASSQLREDIDAYYKSKGAKVAAEWEKEKKRNQPAMEMSGETVINQIKLIPEPDNRRAMCENVLSGMKSGRLDISITDAQVAAFLSKYKKP